MQKMAISDNGEYLIHVVFLTADKVLSRGLQMEGFSKKKINIVKKNDLLSSTTNHQRFKDHFGVSHVAAAQILKDLKTAGVAATNITLKKQKTPRRIPKELDLLLNSLRFMKQYLTEPEREPQLNNTPKTIHNHNWPFIRKLQVKNH